MKKDRPKRNRQVAGRAINKTQQEKLIRRKAEKLARRMAKKADDVHIKNGEHQSRIELLLAAFNEMVDYSDQTCMYKGARGRKVQMSDTARQAASDVIAALNLK